MREIVKSEVGDNIRKKMLLMKNEASIAIGKEGASSLGLSKFIKSWKR